MGSGCGVWEVQGEMGFVYPLGDFGYGVRKEETPVKMR